MQEKSSTMKQIIGEKIFSKIMRHMNHLKIYKNLCKQVLYSIHLSNLLGTIFSILILSNHENIGKVFFLQFCSVSLQFWFTFPYWLRMLSIFSCAFEKCLFKSYACFWIEFLLLNFMSLFCILDIISLQIHDLQLYCSIM